MFRRSEQDLYRDPHGVIHRVVTCGEIALICSSGFLTPTVDRPLLAVVPLSAPVLEALGLDLGPDRAPHGAAAGRDAAENEAATIAARIDARLRDWPLEMAFGPE